MVVSKLFELWDREELIISLETKFGYKRHELLLNQIELNPEESDFLIDLIEKRKSGIPLQYILGKWYFYDIEVKVSEGVLIPRPETEILIEKALELSKSGMKILDIGTGTGIIAITLAKHIKNADVTAVDISDAALNLASENARDNDVVISFVKSNIYDSIDEKFDMIVSNPPYISDNERNKLQKELSYEPEIALFSGEDGLNMIREIINSSDYYLNKKGIIIIEIGYDQGEAVKDLLNQSGFKDIRITKDYNDFDRVVSARKA